MKRINIILLNIAILLLAWGGVSYGAAPKAYVTYTGQTATTVNINVYFDSTGGYNAKNATTMLNDGSDLNWSANMTINGSAPNNYVTIANAGKYMNYFVKITNGTDTSYVRVFPVNTSGYDGATRDFNDYAHGNYNSPTGTAMCAACHSTHSAVKAQLLVRATYYQLCMLCHSSANTQSKYDVEGGLVTVSGSTMSSLAGPFVSSTISKHNADDSAVGWGAVAVPGSDGAKSISLSCVSCHTPHGATNDNYRLIKKTIYASDDKVLSSANITFTAYATTENATSGEQINLISGNAEFCAACHADYDDGNAITAGGFYASNVSPGPGTARYRHPVSVGGTSYSVVGSTGTRNPSFQPTTGDALPLQYYSTQTGVTDKRTAVVCSTCHFAHGSTKSFNIQDTQYDGKYMLRLDNYGVCESCHKK